MNDTVGHPRIGAFILLVFLLVASFAIGYYVHDRQKCPLLTSEELPYVSFLTTGRVTYCDLSPELQRRSTKPEPRSRRSTDADRPRSTAAASDGR